MSADSWVENLFLGLMALGMTWFMLPGIKSAFRQSKESKSDWMGVLLPLGLVVGFVIILIAMV